MPKLEPNPFDPASPSSSVASDVRSDWYRSLVVPLSRAAFWLGLLLVIIGAFIGFYPGSEAVWFGVTAAIVACGIIVPTKACRVATIVILAICLFWTYAGYHRGIEYREWLKARHH